MLATHQSVKNTHHFLQCGVHTPLLADVTVGGGSLSALMIATAAVANVSTTVLSIFPLCIRVTFPVIIGRFGGLLKCS